MEPEGSLQRLQDLRRLSLSLQHSVALTGTYWHLPNYKLGPLNMNNN